jgi:hypothetical protein
MMAELHPARGACTQESTVSDRRHHTAGATVARSVRSYRGALALCRPVGLLFQPIRPTVSPLSRSSPRRRATLGLLGIGVQSRDVSLA